MVEVKVFGIQVQAKITRYVPGLPGKWTGHPDTWYPPEGEEIEYELYNTEGQRVEWLEEKINGTKYEDKLINYLLEVVR